MSKSAANLKQFADLEGQYEILKQLGEGAYGVVAAAKDKATNDKVAIKRIKDAVEDKEQVLGTLGRGFLLPACHLPVYIFICRLYMLHVCERVCDKHGVCPVPVRYSTVRAGCFRGIGADVTRDSLL